MTTDTERRVAELLRLHESCVTKRAAYAVREPNYTKEVVAAAESEFRDALHAALAPPPGDARERAEWDELLQATGVVREMMASREMQNMPEDFQVRIYCVRDGEFNDYRSLRKHHLKRIVDAAAAIEARGQKDGSEG